MNEYGLTYFVYIEDVNARCITTFNIFDHNRFYKDLLIVYEVHKNDFTIFKEELRGVLKYYFWAKPEWEIMISSLLPSKEFNDKKVSVYNQIKINEDKFFEYTWKNLNMLYNNNEDK